jgi:hypothetical protein
MRLLPVPRAAFWCTKMSDDLLEFDE